MSVFSEIKLGDAVMFQRGFDITKAEQTPGPVPIVSSSGISSSHNKVKVEGPGVIIGRKGTLGTVHFITKDYWPHDTTLWVKDFKRNNPQFIAYFLKTLKLENFDTGASNPTLNRNHIHKIKILFPKEPETQRKIAAILTAYDDLIETNKHRIALLEKMAEELYREWFVRMRFPGHQNTRFVKGVPEGWNIVSLKDYCTIVTDGTHDTPKPTDSGHLLITGKNIKNYQIDFSGAYYISEQDHREISKRSGLFEWDILFSNIGTIGQTAIVDKNPDYSVKNVIIFRPGSSADSLFLFHVLKNPAISQSLLAFSSGASQQFIGLNTARKFNILKPSSKLIVKFGEMAFNLFEQRRTLVAMNQSLNNSKSLLLPRLISGKLSVEDLDIQFPPSMQDGGGTQDPVIS